MSAQDNTERVLRSMHVLLSKSEPYEQEPGKVIIDKQTMLDLLSKLNDCIYEIMDEYELTKQSRDRAEREFQKHGDQIVWDASRKAEDIYAASVMYTDEVLDKIQDIMKEATDSVNSIYRKMDEKLKEQEKMVHENQSELKAQLQDLVDTEKYLKLIEERNREIAREKEKKKEQKEGRPAERKSSIYANRQTEVRVNTEYLERLGLSSVDEEAAEEEPKGETADSSGKAEEEKVEEALREAEAQIRVDLDADYFQWKEEEEKAHEQESEAAKQPAREPADFAESIHKVWKNLTSGHKTKDTEE